MLAAFVERLTGFKHLDATELEDGEPPISKQLLKRIKNYQPITSLDRIYQFSSDYRQNWIRVYIPPMIDKKMLIEHTILLR